MMKWVIHFILCVFAVHAVWAQPTVIQSPDAKRAIVQRLLDGVSGFQNFSARYVYDATSFPAFENVEEAEANARRNALANRPGMPNLKPTENPNLAMEHSIKESVKRLTSFSYSTKVFDIASDGKNHKYFEVSNRPNSIQISIFSITFQDFEIYGLVGPNTIQILDRRRDTPSLLSFKHDLVNFLNELDRFTLTESQDRYCFEWQDKNSGSTHSLSYNKSNPSFPIEITHQSQTQKTITRYLEFQTDGTIQYPTLYTQETHAAMRNEENKFLKWTSTTRCVFFKLNSVKDLHDFDVKVPSTCQIQSSRGPTIQIKSDQDFVYILDWVLKNGKNNKK